jgi:hypothetical protein
MHPAGIKDGNGLIVPGSGSTQRPTRDFYERPVKSSKSQFDLRNERRDPIGYFQDDKFGGSMGNHLVNENPKKSGSNPYKPSWNEAQFNGNYNNQREDNQERYQNNNNERNDNNNYNSNNDNMGQYSIDRPNDLLENAMMYQRPVQTVGNNY